MFKDLINRSTSFLIISFIGSLLLVGLILYGEHTSNLDRDSNIHEDPSINENKHNEGRADQEDSSHSDSEDSSKDPKETGHEYNLTMYELNGAWWVELDELVNETSGSYELDQINGTVELLLFDIPFLWIKEVPVVERNGVYLAYEWMPLFKDEKVYFPLDFLVNGLEVQVHRNEKLKEASFTVDPPTQAVFSGMREKQVQLKEMNIGDLISYLSFLSNPIPGATISTVESHLPGARRAYRNGYHEGIDWYNGASGRVIDVNTPVLSVADGVVVRADLNYVEFEEEERDAFLSWSGQLTDTPTYVLDKLRGRSVWVQYEQGVMIRYAHLSRIEEGIYVGKKVERGHTLGYVGNSGTSFAVSNENPYGGLHLHADLLIYGELFWKYIHQSDQVREVLNEIFNDPT